jgi:hypothetical protein
MPLSIEFNANAAAGLSRHVSESLRLRRKTGEILSATQETIAQSRAIVAEADALLAVHATRVECLWPAY